MRFFGKVKGQGAPRPDPARGRRIRGPQTANKSRQMSGCGARALFGQVRAPMDDTDIRARASRTGHARLLIPFPHKRNPTLLAAMPLGFAMQR